MTFTLRTITISLAVALVVFGAIGMLICFMFLWSNDIRDINGAGMGFIAGAAMLGSGCIALAICSRPAIATSQP